MSSIIISLQIFIFIFFYTAASKTTAQTLTYDIYKGTDRIGEIEVTKTRKGNVTAYEANSNSEFRVFFMNELETRLAAEYENNELIACRSKNTLNGKIRNHATMKKNGEVYQLYRHPDEKFEKKEKPIEISTVLLYYSEPLNISRVYSENYLEHCPLRPIGKNTYELVLPGEKINHYVYKNGKLEEIKVFRTFVDLSFRLRKHS